MGAIEATEAALHSPMLQATVSVAELGLAVLAGVLGYLLVSRPAALREQRIERSQAYLELELASIEVFKYKAENWYALNWVLTKKNPQRLPGSQLREIADQYFYQCLNLFEVASRFRKVGIIEKHVYASWVAWFYEVLEVPYFREQWEEKYRDNYTPELQDIFDAGVALWAGEEGAEVPVPDDLGKVGPKGGETELRRRQFYQFVGWYLACPIIAYWHDRPPERIGLLARLRRVRYRLTPP